MKRKKKLILEGIFAKLSPMSYPGRIYGMYVWDFDKNKWIVNENFCELYNINVG